MMDEGLSAYSGTPEGGRAMLMTSLIRVAFSTRSLGVVDVSDGDALTCSYTQVRERAPHRTLPDTSRSHGFRLLSMRMSYL